MKLTQGFVRELISYNSYTGAMTWRTRDRKWFSSDGAWKRWNKRYAGTPAFTYIVRGYRWGCIFNNNFLAHRVVWVYVHGRLPTAIMFRDSDGTNLKLDNLVERKAGRLPQVTIKRGPRERLPLAA